MVAGSGGQVRFGMEEVRITPYEDGPRLVRGAFRVVDQDGNEIETRRRAVALCRCGRSRIRPFCDGTHKLVRFRASSAAESAADQADLET